MRISKLQRKLVTVVILFIGMILFLHWQNNGITISNYDILNNKIPSEFQGFKVLQISDLHNKGFGTEQKTLIKKVVNIQPDIIVLTGDLIDSNRINIDKAIELVSGIQHVAPIYYVSGNHEAASGVYGELKNRLLENKVNILEDTLVQYEKDGQHISILGLEDTSFGGVEKMKEALSSALLDNDDFKIVLSHRPEYFPIYVQSEGNLVFSGHAHGGQVRIPFVGGMVAPGQGFFPELTEGVHQEGDTTMVISRGLGNSVIPIRLFNRPELVVVNLYKDK